MLGDAQDGERVGSEQVAADVLAGHGDHRAAGVEAVDGVEQGGDLVGLGGAGGADHGGGSAARLRKSCCTTAKAMTCSPRAPRRR